MVPDDAVCDPYATHGVMLSWAAQLAAQEAKGLPFVELGCGFYSTPWLAAMTAVAGVPYEVIYENEAWATRLRGMLANYSHIQWTALKDWRTVGKVITSPRIGLLFVDQEQLTSDRFNSVLLLRQRTEIMVCHDSDRYIDKLRGVGFRFSAHFDKQHPWTSVFSDSTELAPGFGAQPLDPWRAFEARWVSGGSETACGVGSTWAFAKAFAAWLPGLLKRHSIEVLNDAGCGDFNWMKRVDLAGVDYLGYDIVPPARTILPFQKLNFVEADMRPADAVLCRDVLFHFPTDVVETALARIKTSAPVLIATSHPGARVHRHRWSTGVGFSALDLVPLLGSPLETLPEAHSGRIVGLWRLK